MRLKLQIDYHTDWGQTVYACGSVPALGNWEKDKAAEMKNISPSIWELEIEAGDVTDIEYQYLVKDQSNIVAHEWGSPHWLRTETDKRFDVQDVWRGVPQQKFLYTSCFSESFFAHGDNAKVKYYKKTILINVTCVNVKKNQKLILCGASKALGDWKPEDALSLTQVRFGSWQVAINAPQIKTTLEYKLAIYDNSTKKIVHWEEGFNRVLSPLPSSPAKEDLVKVESIAYRYGWLNWKAAGLPAVGGRTRRGAPAGRRPFSHPGPKPPARRVKKPRTGRLGHFGSPKNPPRIWRRIFPFSKSRMLQRNIQHLKAYGAAVGHDDVDLVADLVPQQGAADGGFVRDRVHLRVVGFHGGGDAVRQLLVELHIQYGHHRTYRNGICRDLLLAYKARLFKLLLQGVDLAFHKGLLVLGLVVLAVLR